MRQAGIKYVAIGFESPIDEELKAMNKAIRSRDMLSLVQVYHRFGFLIHGMFIFGYPLAERAAFTMPVRERVQRFRRFIRQAKIDTVQVLLPVPLPGTGLRRRLEEQNRIYALQDVGWEYYDGNFPLFEPDEPMTAQEIQAAGKQIMSRVYRFRHVLYVVGNILLVPLPRLLSAQSPAGLGEMVPVLAEQSHSLRRLDHACENGVPTSGRAISCRRCRQPATAWPLRTEQNRFPRKQIASYRYLRRRNGNAPSEIGLYEQYRSAATRRPNRRGATKPRGDSGRQVKNLGKGS